MIVAGGGAAVRANSVGFCVKLAVSQRGSDTPACEILSMRGKIAICIGLL